MNKKYLMSVVSSFLLFSSMYSIAAVERVVSFTVSDPTGLIAAFDRYFATGEPDNDTVTLFQNVVNGSDPSTHTLVAIFKNMKDLESTLDKQAKSADFATLGRSLSAVSSNSSEALAVQRKTWGKNGWSEGDYLAAVIVNSPDEPTWMASLDEMQSKSKIKMPGMVRVVRLRGDIGSHAVLITAPTYAGLIGYLEEVEASADFAEYRSKHQTRPVATHIYKAVKVWK